MAPRSTKKRHRPQQSEGEEDGSSDTVSGESGDDNNGTDNSKTEVTEGTTIEVEQDEEQSQCSDEHLSDEEPSDEEEEEEHEYPDTSEMIRKKGKKGRASRCRRKNTRDVDPSKGNIYSLKNELRDKGIGMCATWIAILNVLALQPYANLYCASGWNICDTCGQATSVELPYRLAKTTEKWNCRFVLPSTSTKTYDSGLTGH